ncbi:hypothetical protein T45_07824 [Streptomyces turgidiscabies]|nr:hypothetical protein T45_07824 [Streptomyces turgidiscabies]
MSCSRLILDRLGTICSAHSYNPVLLSFCSSALLVPVTRERLVNA